MGFFNENDSLACFEILEIVVRSVFDRGLFQDFWFSSSLVGFFKGLEGYTSQHNVLVGLTLFSMGGRG